LTISKNWAETMSASNAERSAVDKTTFYTLITSSNL